MPRVKKGTKISDLAGSWKMTDEEANGLLAAIDESWKNWRLHDVFGLNAKKSLSTERKKKTVKNRK